MEVVSVLQINSMIHLLPFAKVLSSILYIQDCHPTCTSCSNPDNCCSTILYSQFNISTNTCEC